MIIYESCALGALSASNATTYEARGPLISLGTPQYFKVKIEERYRNFLLISSMNSRVEYMGWLLENKVAYLRPKLFALSGLSKALFTSNIRTISILAYFIKLN